MRMLIALFALATMAAGQALPRAPRAPVVVLLQEAPDSIQVAARWGASRPASLVRGYAVTARADSRLVGDSVPRSQLADSLWVPRDTADAEWWVCVLALTDRGPSDASCKSVTVPALERVGAPGPLEVFLVGDSAAVPPDTAVPPPPDTSGLVPQALRATLGPLMARPPTQDPTVAGFDQRFQQTEQARFNDWLPNKTNNDWAVAANHYGALRSRLQWAIRTGQPYGRGVTDDSRYAYARGRRILLAYLAWSAGHQYVNQPHNNTGLPDIEALYVLEGNTDAWNHIWVTCEFHSTDPYGLYKMQNPNADARQIAVGIQAFDACQRLAIPYARNPANASVGFDASAGSWKALGERQITWLTQYDGVKADGSVPSPAHGGPEAYLFNAMLATELLRWYGYVDAQTQYLELARRIVDHLIAKQGNAATLPYLSTDASPAPDLAAFYVWPGLVLWQETGQAKYRDWAMRNLAATAGAYLTGIKQWNQTYSTGAESAEALLAGVRWR